MGEKTKVTARKTAAPRKRSAAAKPAKDKVAETPKKKKSILGRLFGKK